MPSSWRGSISIEPDSEASTLGPMPSMGRVAQGIRAGGTRHLRRTENRFGLRMRVPESQ